MSKLKSATTIEACNMARSRALWRVTDAIGQMEQGDIIQLDMPNVALFEGEA